MWSGVQLSYNSLHIVPTNSVQSNDCQSQSEKRGQDDISQKEDQRQGDQRQEDDQRTQKENTNGLYKQWYWPNILGNGL